MKRVSQETIIASLSSPIAVDVPECIVRLYASQLMPCGHGTNAP